MIEVMRHFGFRRNYQVAEYFDVTPQTLSGWLKSGEIPPKHLIKYTSEIANNENDFTKRTLINDRNYSIDYLKNLIVKNLKVLLLPPIFVTTIVGLYTFFIADIIYTSKSKVLPISEDGGGSSSFSGFASQLGINIPLNIGGTVPWDEIYPEILKSSDLMESMLGINYFTDRHGNKSLKEILIIEKKLEKYSKRDQTNRAIDNLKEMIKISKDRTSPIVNIHVNAFEPVFASKLLKDLIDKSSLIQRELKTKRVRQKRVFIEERLEQVSKEMKDMEKVLREFRENNRNLSSSPSLQMKVQEMGREVDLQNSLYVTLKTQYEKAKIDEVGRDDMVQKIDGPTIPTKLTSPKRTFMILIAFFVGIFSSIFFLYVKEQHFTRHSSRSF